ncbi:MAG: RNA polymerase sigma factor [Clostridia bacterium]|nr:RNA polymerase sigma factor [Clostridia bacterium]
MAEIERLYREYYGFIFKFLLNLCHNESLADELAQETFFRAYINLKSLRNEEKAASWLCRIAKNLYFAWYNEQKKLAPMETAEVHSAQDVAETVANKLLTKEVMHHVTRLEEPYKEVFMLAVFGEVSLKEISRLFQKSESWARVTFYRAKQKIIEEMRA